MAVNSTTQSANNDKSKQLQAYFVHILPVMCYTFFFLPMCLRHRTLVLGSQMVNKLSRYSQYFRVKGRLQWDALLRILHLSYSCGWVRKTGEHVEKKSEWLGGLNTILCSISRI